MGRSRDLADGTLAELNVDSNTLAVDATNNRVGIGTTSDGAKLKIVSDNGQIGLQANAGDGSSLYIGASGSNYFDSSSGGSNIFRTSSTERMRIDSSGRVTMPYQPSFCAYDSNGWQNFSTRTQLTFNTVEWNIGSHYNSSTGVFTAPVAGVYWVTSQIYALNSATVGGNFIYVNNAQQSRLYAVIQENTAADNTCVLTSTIKLSAGDTLKVMYEGDRYGLHSFFAAHLLG